MKKKREYQSSELVKSFAKIHGFEDKLIAFRIKDFLEEYLDQHLFEEIISVNLKDEILLLKVRSPMLKNDFRLKKNFLLKKFQEQESADKIKDLIVF